MPFRKTRPIFKKKAREQRKKNRSRKIKQAMTFSIMMIIILASHNVFGVHLLFNEMIPATEVVKGERTFSTSGLWPQIKINRNVTWNKSMPWFNLDDKISSSISSSETSSYSEEDLVPSKVLPNSSLPPRIILKHLSMDDDQANIAVSVHHMDEAKVKINKLCTVLAYVCMTIAFAFGIIIALVVLSNTCLKSCCGRQNRPVPRLRASAAMDARQRIVIPSYDRLYYPDLSPQTLTTTLSFTSRMRQLGRCSESLA